MNLPTQAPPYVSIGLPVYNGEHFLGRALDTLLGQEFGDLEIVVSDNASTDGTVELLRKYADQDPRLHFEVQPKNRGAAWNFNRVLEMAHSGARYFTWAAADDERTPDYLTRTVAILDSDPSVSLAHTGSADIDPDGFVLKTWTQPVETWASPDVAERVAGLVTMRHECFTAFGLIRTEIARETHGLGPYADADNVLITEIGLRGRFVHDDAVCFLRRQHPFRSMVYFTDQRERVAWFDPSRAGQLSFPYWRALRELVGAIERAPLSAEDRRRCLFALRVYLRNNWPGLAKNVVRSAVEAPRTLIADARRRSEADA